MKLNYSQEQNFVDRFLYVSFSQLIFAYISSSVCMNLDILKLLPTYTSLITLALVKYISPNSTVSITTHKYSELYTIHLLRYDRAEIVPEVAVRHKFKTDHYLNTEWQRE